MQNHLRELFWYSDISLLLKFNSRNCSFPRVGNYSKPRVLKRRGVGGNCVSVISTIEPEKAAEHLRKQ